jgi:membrane-bound lytic murein transglycosylase D
MLIDQCEVHHYYAQMIFRLGLIIFFSTLLNACGHSVKPSLPEAFPQDTVEGKNTRDVQGQDVGESNSMESQPTGIDSHSLKDKHELDLLTRIKNGFRLPPFESKYIQDYEKWKTQHPTYLTDMFARAEPFLFYIVEEVEKRAMPMEVALLPAVESAFKPRAYSRSSASGLWQFIPSTGKHYGLTQDWWYDGRRNAIASTNAALDYLQELNTLFDGDWLLTFAAYNAGQGTVLRAIKKNQHRKQPSRYQDLDLRSETRRYVPKLYAIRNIIESPEEYGVVLPKLPNKPQFSIVDIPGQIDLAQFAKVSGIDLDELRHLNAAHLRWATSPAGPHKLLIPIENIERAKETLANNQLQPSVEYQNHLIRRGDTLSTIARRFGVSVDGIKQVNNLQSSSIRAGKTLLIPIPKKSNQAIVSALSEQDLQGNATRSGVTFVATASQAGSESQVVHRVVAGDTLWSIAKRYSVKVSQLLSWNRLSANQILNLDQSLLIIRQ